MRGRTSIIRPLLAGGLALCLASASEAQTAATPAEMVASQQAAISRLAGFEGLWRGPGWTLVDGKRVTQTVTQRVGSFLDGANQVIETRSFAPDGTVAFHAFNNVAFDAQKSEYVMQARAGGRFGNFPMRVTADGYVWELGFGGRGLRYTGTLHDGVWTEVTEQISPEGPPQAIGQFTLRRTGATDWPNGGALKAR